MIRRTTAAAVLMLTFAAAPALAADERDGKTAVVSGAISDSRGYAPLASDGGSLVAPLKLDASAATRPAVLTTLYVSFSALQAYDAYSTLNGLKNGARESNPMMQSIVGSPAKFFTIKAATAGVSIFVAERMWKKNKVGAIVTMALANSVSAVVAARNASVLNQVR